VDIFGKKYTREQIENYVGRFRQVAGSRKYRLSEGKAEGVRGVDVNAGNGFHYTVLPDRCMDISLCSYKGINLVYQGETGEVHPSYYTGIGNDWMKGFFAGLVTTCGLQNLGAPCTDEGESYGLHGDIAYVPAENFNDLSRWENDDYILEFEGVMQESVFFGSKLILRRNIKSVAGERKLVITDRVENAGMKETPFLILYHINAGFPLLDENARLVLSSKSVWGYDEQSVKNMDKHRIFDPPQEFFPEENFLHTMAADEDGRCYAGVLNPSLGQGLGLYISANVDALPFISQWKSAANKEYVLAIEPVNTKVANRVQLKKEGILPYLKPGETKEMRVEIGILDGADQLSAFEQKVNRILERV
jgi:hypothetical protein